MTFLRSVLLIAAFACQAYAVEVFARQFTCGGTGTVNIGGGLVLYTPSFPSLYSPTVNCLWSFTSSPGGYLLVRCAGSVPCSDSFTIASVSGTNTTFCGANSVLVSAGSAVNITLKPSSTSTGGVGICVVAALMAPTTTPSPTTSARTTTLSQATPLRTTPLPLTTPPPPSTPPKTTLLPPTTPPSPTTPPKITPLFPTTPLPLSTPPKTTPLPLTTPPPPSTPSKTTLLPPTTPPSPTTPPKTTPLPLTTPPPPSTPPKTTPLLPTTPPSPTTPPKTTSLPLTTPPPPSTPPKTTPQVPTTPSLPTTPPKSTPPPPTTPARTTLAVTPPASTPVTTNPNSNCTCGIAGPGPNRIVGGSPAGQNQFPWMVLVQSNGFICGGSIISPGWVVTAAHCFDSPSPTGVNVIAGGYSLTASSPTEQPSDVTQIFIHPGWNNSTKDNDIALLKLTTPFTFNSAVSPICLPIKFPTFDFANQTGIASGWGTTVSGGEASDILLQVRLPILSTTQCKNYIIVANKITNNMICTYTPGKDTCQGDSGGPLGWVDPVSKRTILAGITSFGVGCAGVNSPGVYVKVNNYLTWIQQTTGQTFCSP